MIAALVILIFTGAFAASVAVIAIAVGPQWQRIAQLMTGSVEAPFAPLAWLAIAEQRIAVRRWSALSSPPAVLWRAAA